MTSWPGAGRRRATAGARWAVALLAALGMALAAVPRAVRADGGAPNLAYVAGAGAGGGDLAVIDIAQRRVTGHIHVGGGPRGILLSIDGRYAYVAQAAAGRIAVVDARAMRVVATLPAGKEPDTLAQDVSVTGDMFVANAGSDTVTVYDLARQRLIATIPVGKHPDGVAVAEPGSIGGDGSDAEVYVANRDDGTVSVISAARRTVLATVAVPSKPTGVVVPTEALGAVAYVTTTDGGVWAIDAIAHRLLGRVLQVPGGQLGRMDYDGVTGQIYVPDAAGGTVAILRPLAGGGGATPTVPDEPARTLAFAGAPAAVAITFDGALGFVAERAAGRVAMFDVPTRQVLTTIAVQGAPEAVITGSYPPLLNQQTASVVGVLAYALVGLVILAVLGYYLGWFRAIAARLRSGGPAGGAREPKSGT